MTMITLKFAVQAAIQLSPVIKIKFINLKTQINDV